MSDVLDEYDALARDEKHAWLGFWNGARSRVTEYSNRPGSVCFGKAECQWVDFHEFWLGKLVDLGWVTVAKSEPFECKGAAPGVTGVDYQIRVTEKGRRVRNEELARYFDRAASA